MKIETRVGIFIVISVGIFFYLSLNIGAIRLDQRLYYLYKTYFDDTGGLDEKASIKIAGVEVGWVEKIELLEGGKAEVHLMIKKNYKLARNAYATIQQEGLIGTKHIDIEPGDPTTGTLPPGSVLAMPGRPPTSVGDLLDQFKDIASGVQAVVESFKNTFGTQQGEKNLKLALDSVARATSKIASLSDVLERTLAKNEQNINLMVQDFQITARHLSTTIPSIQKNFDNVSTSLTENTLPYISDASQKAGTAFEHIGDTAQHMRGTFKETEEVVGKINQGKGTLGKFINEDETYNDVKKAVKGLKDMVSKADALDILIDIHSENHVRTDNSKGYLEARLRPSNDYFYNIQLVSDEYGSVRKTEKHYKRFDAHNDLLSSDELTTQWQRMDKPDRKEVITRIKNDILFGFQFGKRFNRVALRIGMFENAFGAGIDYYVPLGTDKIHWISSLEAFDFKSANRIEGQRPHLKWINKFYFMRNLYTTFGIDDFVSKTRATPFFGAGIRFGDEDIKYFLSYIPIKGVGNK